MKAGVNKQGVQTYKNVIRHYYKKITFTEDTTWTVPENISSVTVDCVAGQGRSLNTTAVGGKGGRVQCILNVTPHQILTLKVGKQYQTVSDNRNDSLISFTGDDLDAVVHAGGGGSASNPVWIRTKNVVGGPGGGLVGGQGTVNAPGGILSGGGTQTAGGVGPYYNQPSIKGQDYRTQGTGGRLTGGAPFAATDGSVGGQRTGCGGAGYYGGGGGLVDYYYGGSSKYETYAIGAGGGSSYTNPDLCSEVVHTQGYQDGNGYISLDYEVAETDEYDYYKDTIIIKALK